MKPERRLFGTDGIRGRFGESPFLPHQLTILAQAVSVFLTHKHPLNAPIFLGMDTRLSCPLIEKALRHAFSTLGLPTLSLGILPTPALAYLTCVHKAALGIMISASHNPFEDNGLKFFNTKGEKLSDSDEQMLEALYIQALQTNTSLNQDWCIFGEPVFQACHPASDMQEAYRAFLHATVPPAFTLRSLKIVIDCAHGAAFHMGPSLLKTFGATVFPLGNEPNGRNINAKCGALYPQALQKAVQEYEADWGIALDGDADRLVLVDREGRLIDGEQILAFLALHWKREGRLPKPEIVSTVMANGAFEHFLTHNDLTLWRTAVGDRSITEQLVQRDLPLGGEPSGHLILRNFHTCGDALLATLQVLRLLLEIDQPAAEVFPLFKPFPQILKNIPLPSQDILGHISVQNFLREIQARLAEQESRLLVRPSGTEPLLRILVEGKNLALLQTTTHQVVDFFQKI